MIESSISIDPDASTPYRAFLSYSHADGQAAARLHRWLETYAIPRHLVGTPSPTQGVVPRRLTPIFQDRAELPAAASLDLAVRQALSRSEALIILCSPSARASRWVNAEIDLFRQMHPTRPIIAALLAGDPADSFPPALFASGPDGTRQEPIAADFRTDQDGTKLARLKIVAGITGIALDRIIQRDAQRQLRRVIGITCFAIALVLLMSLSLLFVARARAEAENQRQQAEGLIEYMLTDLRERVRGVGRLDILQSVNQRALAYYADQSDIADLPHASLERRARIFQAMGEDDCRQGHVKSARAEFREAHRVTATLLAAQQDDPERLFAHAQSEFWLGYMDYMEQRPASALPRFLAYQALAQRLVALRPRQARYWRELAFAQGNICTMAIDGGKAGRPLDSCRQSLDTMTRVSVMLPGDPAIQADLANRHAWMADALKLDGQVVRALEERRRQGAILQQLIGQDPKNMAYRQDWILARYSMAMLLHATDRAAQAQALLDGARADVDRLVASDPSNQDWKAWRRKLARPLGEMKR